MDSRTLSRILTRGMTLISHLVPSRPGLWIPGPGWLEWPIGIGPNWRRELKRHQLAPISVERLLQMRIGEPDRDKRPKTELPKDSTLEDAVARMSEAARAAEKMSLVMMPQEWRGLVDKHLGGPDVMAFVKEVAERVGEVKDEAEMNRWFGLAMNIWNATPQPNRGGKTAYELLDEEMRGRRSQ